MSRDEAYFCRRDSRMSPEPDKKRNKTLRLFISFPFQDSTANNTKIAGPQKGASQSDPAGIMPINHESVAV